MTIRTCMYCSNFSSNSYVLMMKHFRASYEDSDFNCKGGFYL